MRKSLLSVLLLGFSFLAYGVPPCGYYELDPELFKQSEKVDEQNRFQVTYDGAYLFSIPDDKKATGTLSQILIQAKRNKTTVKRWGENTYYTADLLRQELIGEKYSEKSEGLDSGLTPYDPRSQVETIRQEYKRLGLKYRSTYHGIIVRDPDGNITQNIVLEAEHYKAINAIVATAKGKKRYLYLDPLALSQHAEFYRKPKKHKGFVVRDLMTYFKVSHRPLPQVRIPEVQEASLVQESLYPQLPEAAVRAGVREGARAVAVSPNLRQGQLPPTAVSHSASGGGRASGGPVVSPPSESQQLAQAVYTATVDDSE